jgi:hypothetical protein
MKVNKQLEKMAHRDPTKDSRSMAISELCAGIKANTITLPVYQRSMSWTLTKAIELLNYQLLGEAAVSAISMNQIYQTTECVEQVSFIDRDKGIEPRVSQLSVVDGQQRLTTNYMAYTNDPEFKSVVLDVTRGKFLESDAPTECQIPVGVLLNENPDVYQKYIKKHPQLEDVSLLLGQVRTKWNNYRYVVNIATDLTEKQQLLWFEVLNNAGTSVSSLEMAFSKLRVTGIDIYKDYIYKFVEIISANNFDSIYTQKRTEVSYPVAALNPSIEIVTGRAHNNNFSVMPSDVKPGEIAKLSPADITQCFTLTLTGLEQVMDFIDTNNLRSVITRMDYVGNLLGFMVYRKNKKLDNAANDFLVDWCKKVDFSSKSNTERRGILNKLLLEALKF